MAAFVATRVPVRVAAFTESARGRASDNVRAPAVSRKTLRPIHRPRCVPNAPSIEATARRETLGVQEIDRQRLASIAHAYFGVAVVRVTLRTRRRRVARVVRAARIETRVECRRVFRFVL
jgi:hypothetical protein